jgi:hypothetical protein
MPPPASPAGAASWLGSGKAGRGARSCDRCERGEAIAHPLRRGRRVVAVAEHQADARRLPRERSRPFADLVELLVGVAPAEALARRAPPQVAVGVASVGAQVPEVVARDRVDARQDWRRVERRRVDADESRARATSKATGTPPRGSASTTTSSRPAYSLSRSASSPPASARFLKR